MTRHVADDVGVVREQLAAAGDRLSLPAPDDSDAPRGPLAASVLGVVREVIELNASLQQRLAAAEGQLARQAEQIDGYLCEARTDGLTGLPNRRALDDELRRAAALAVRKGYPLYFMLLDVDHFKELNDSHGHLAGDEALRQLARRLVGFLRDTDLVARFGGEEFAVVMPDIAREHAAAVAERIRQRVAEAPFSLEGRTLCATVSVGVAGYVPGEDVAALVLRADEALYASKRAGRNRCHAHDGARPLPIPRGGAGVAADSPNATAAAGADESLAAVCDELRRHHATTTRVEAM
jgi:diguanylate cyclase